MGTILIVDDQMDSCRPLARLVRHLGHKGDYATSGPAALEYVRTHTPDLIVLDVMMPGMDGMEVLTHLRADPRTRDLPVVMFTALDEPSVRKRTRDLGANDYWIKASMNFDELSERLGAYLHPACPIAPDKPKPSAQALRAN